MEKIHINTASTSYRRAINALCGFFMSREWGEYLHSSDNLAWQYYFRCDGIGFVPSAEEIYRYLEGDTTIDWRDIDGIKCILEYEVKTNSL